MRYAAFVRIFVPAGLAAPVRIVLRPAALFTLAGVGLVLLALALGPNLTLAQTPTPGPTPTPAPTIPPDWIDACEGGTATLPHLEGREEGVWAIIVKIEGDPSQEIIIELPDGTSPDAAVGMILPSGSSIATGEEAQVTICLAGRLDGKDFTNSWMIVRPISEIIIDRFLMEDASKSVVTRIKIRTGEIRVKITEERTDYSTDLKVATPNATNTIVGTEFDVRVSPGFDSTKVYSGSVLVEANVGGASQQVLPGQEVRVFPDGTIEFVPIHLEVPPVANVYDFESAAHVWSGSAAADIMLGSDPILGYREIHGLNGGAVARLGLVDFAATGCAEATMATYSSVVETAVSPPIPTVGTVFLARTGDGTFVKFRLTEIDFTAPNGLEFIPEVLDCPQQVTRGYGLSGSSNGVGWSWLIQDAIVSFGGDVPDNTVPPGGTSSAIRDAFVDSINSVRPDTAVPVGNSGFEITFNADFEFLVGALGNADCLVGYGPCQFNPTIQQVSGPSASVGGVTELLVGDSSSAREYAVPIAAMAAGALALALGGWYARRRLLP